MSDGLSCELVSEYTSGSMASMAWVSDKTSASTSGQRSSAQYFSKICFTDDSFVGGEGDLA